MFSLCIMWHTSITEKAQGLQSLIHRRSVGPAAWSSACMFSPCFLLLYCHRGNRGRVSGVACGWETTAGCPLTGRDAAASVSGGGALLPLLAPLWIMDSARVRCQDAISYSWTCAYVDPGILNWRRRENPVSLKSHARCGAIIFRKVAGWFNICFFDETENLEILRSKPENVEKWV